MNIVQTMRDNLPMMLNRARKIIAMNDKSYLKMEPVLTALHFKDKKMMVKLVEQTSALIIKSYWKMAHANSVLLEQNLIQIKGHAPLKYALAVNFWRMMANVKTVHAKQDWIKQARNVYLTSVIQIQS